MRGRMLSIGNGNYEHIQPNLDNAINDANEIGLAFGPQFVRPHDLYVHLYSPGADPLCDALHVVQGLTASIH